MATKLEMLSFSLGRLVRFFSFSLFRRLGLWLCDLSVMLHIAGVFCFVRADKLNVRRRILKGQALLDAHPDPRS